MLKISSILFIDEHKIQVITGAELFVDIPECRCKVETTKEQPYRDRFPFLKENVGLKVSKTELGWGGLILTSDWGTIHDFEFGNRLAFVVLVRRRTRCFATDDGQFHVFDLYSD